MPTYEKNKAHIYKWRDKNPEHNRTVNRIAQTKFRTWKNIQMIYLAILLN